MKVCGVDAMSIVTHRAVEAAVGGSRLENGDPDVYRMRLIKSPAETAVLARSWEICDPATARCSTPTSWGSPRRRPRRSREGPPGPRAPSNVTFTIMCSGARTDTAVGRPTRKVIARATW